MRRTSPSSKIKVSTDSLLAAVKARRVQVVKEHSAAQAAYEKNKKGFSARVAAALRDAADRAEKGTIPEMGYRSIQVAFRGKQPEKPRLCLEDLDRLIKTLEMAAESTITISADDAAQYLG